LSTCDRFSIQFSNELFTLCYSINFLLTFGRLYIITRYQHTHNFNKEYEIINGKNYKTHKIKSLKLDEIKGEIKFVHEEYK